MKFDVCFLLSLLFGAILVDASVYLNRPGLPLPLRLKRLQHRSAMYGEYYQPQMMYIPAMTSFTSGGSLSTDYLNSQPEEPPCSSCNNIPQEPEPELEETTNVYKTEEEQFPEEETFISTSTKIPIFKEVTTQKTKTKILPKKPAQEEEENDDEYNDWPYEKNQRRKVPPYNVFFPMMFGGHGSLGRSGQNSGYPSGATAIANSFSSGKGGVATSHATAYGNAPPLNKHSDWEKRSQNEE